MSGGANARGLQVLTQLSPTLVSENCRHDPTPYIHRRKLRRDDRTDGIVSPYPDAHLPRTVSNSKRNQELHMRLTTNRQKMSTPMMLIGILGAHNA